jgi:peroxiredoxin 2/4
MLISISKIMEETKTTSMPCFGDKAPEFKSVTTQGKINFPSDYTGYRGILFSHPTFPFKCLSGNFLMDC